MKFTSEDLMKAMGLQVGDRIKINNVIYTISTDYLLINENTEGYYHFSRITYLVEDEVEYEILPKPKKVGELKCCVDVICVDCPIRLICSGDYITDETLNENLEYFNIRNDLEVYNLFKARLDKEVNE